MIAASFNEYICIEKNKNVTNHSVPEAQKNERTEMWMDTRKHRIKIVKDQTREMGK